ncbi:AMMECR1 domain-containing protein [Patescibacteria group bacterium]|nr:MAG: AMMECR1 domain-containing protein [Patescibacteria group bacterium]
MDPYVALAKRTIEKYIIENKVVEAPKDLPPDFYSRRAGVFVTIYSHGESRGLPRDEHAGLRGLPRGEHAGLRGLPRGEQERVLRGCVGTFLPTCDNLAEEIIQNAVSACSEDYRFDPIEAAELKNITCEVSVLSEPVSVQDLAAHDVRQHGIIVQSGRRRGLLLPDLEGVDTTEQQIAIAAEKGGIDPEQDPISLFEFTVEKHR